MVQLSEKFSGAIGLLWVDLETTGSDEHHDDIIEIGSVLTDFNFDRFDYRASRDFSRVIEPSDYALGRLMKERVVRNMHMINGLLDDCMDLPSRFRSIKAAEEEFINWIGMAINSKRPRGNPEKFKYMLAGSGVGHFDRRFIKVHMPRLDKMLVFAPLDVGDTRRLMKMSGVEPSADNSDQKNHRALDDVLLHLEEARAYRDMFRNYEAMKAEALTQKADVQ